jgi:MFS family permease
MWESVLKLSNSRALLVGAVVVDTLCLGLLACIATLHGAVLTTSAAVLVLIALAVTGPVLAISVAFCTQMVPAWLPEEERGRRAILAGTVLHSGAQIATLLSAFCGKEPKSLPGYFVETFGVVFILSVLMLIPTFILRKKRSKERSPVWPAAENQANEKKSDA